VGEGTAIGQGSIIRNSIIGANAEIRPYCVINDSVIGNGSKIGPFAHLREGTQLDSGVHIGNYVETKKALLRAGAKANHLSYLGDCEVGEKSNIGAGCITCNYDGANKHRTKIGRDAFVGSDCQLVAPVTVGNGAILAAGTTLTTDVPDDALALTRPETTIKEGGATKIRAKLKLGSSSVSS
jgi:bifunctional UDP-N-acetylglucosamine pyrophosphorylase/glucosamine-1-phosphate N-acetyltransferase